MRLDVVENGRERLHLTVHANAFLYGFFGLLFIALGGMCILLLAIPDSSVAGWMLGLVCIGSGVVICAAIQQVRLIADRATGNLRITRRLLLWPVEQQYEFALAELEPVSVTAHTLQTARHVVTSHAVRLQGRSLTFLPMFTRGDADELASIISDWTRAG